MGQAAQFRRPKAMLFDMGDTLIVEKEPDFQSGARRLLELAANPRGIEKAEVLESSRELTKWLLEARATAMLEFSCKAMQRLIHDRYGMTFSMSPQEVELEFRRASFHSTEAPGIRRVLAALDESGIRRAVLSNSIFTQATLEHELERLGLLAGFEFVMASVDYGVRKPHPALFLAAAGRLGLDAPEVCYAGDNWDCDMSGAGAVGMQTVWYNPSGRSCPGPSSPTVEVHSWDEFLEVLKPA